MASSNAGIMHVHHHPEITKKTIKEYLFEGLMIFMAVTLGFIAENIRETFKNHEIEKRNMQIVVENLSDDTAHLMRVIRFNQRKMQLLDSITSFRGKNLADTNNLGKFYGFYTESVAMVKFYSNDAALQQMKNSGSMRLVNSKQVLDSLFHYSSVNVLVNDLGNYLDRFTTISTEDATRFLEFGAENLNDAAGWLQGKNTEMFKFYNDQFTLKHVIYNYYQPVLIKQKTSAENLILLLKKEYKIQ